MRADPLSVPVEDEQGSDLRLYLKRRVRDEAEAAISASSMPAMLIHIALATAYAKRFGESEHAAASWVRDPWTERHRIW
jgi:hypothetical protein